MSAPGGTSSSSSMSAAVGESSAAAPAAAAKVDKTGPSKSVERAKKLLTDGTRSLILCNTKLKNEEVVLLSPCIRTSDTLMSLSLFDSGLNVDTVKTLCQALAKQESLTLLDLGHNDFGHEGVEAVCDAVIHNTCILTLGLAQVGMGDKGALSMADVVRQNCSITELYLNSNGITAEGATELADALIFNNKSQISELYLFGNDMGQGEDEFQKLLQEVPEAEENVELVKEMAMAFAMGTHTRLGDISSVQQLGSQQLGSSYVKNRNGTAKKAKSLLQVVVNACVTQRLVKRNIFGLSAPKAAATGGDKSKPASAKAVPHPVAAAAPPPG